MTPGIDDKTTARIERRKAEERRLLRDRYPRLALAGKILLGILFLAAAIWALA